MANKIEVNGLKELNKALANLPAKIHKNIANSMVRAGAQAVRKKAAANAGVPKKYIGVKKSRSKSKVSGRTVFNVGPTNEHWQMRFIEFGTKPHIIQVSNKKLLSDGQSVYGYRVEHPGQPAIPFLRPALYENVMAIVEAMRLQGAKRFDKEMAKR